MSSSGCSLFAGYCGTLQHCKPWVFRLCGQSEVEGLGCVGEYVPGDCNGKVRADGEVPHAELKDVSPHTDTTTICSLSISPPVIMAHGGHGHGPLGARVWSLEGCVHQQAMSSLVHQPWDTI